jgi:hypothetical protein
MMVFGLRSSVFGLILVAIVATSARADSVPDIVTKKLQVPTGLRVEKVFVPPSMEKLDVKPDDVLVEQVREPREGRFSIRVTVGTKTSWVQVALRKSALAEDRRPKTEDQLSLPRGTKVTLVVHRGGLVVRGPATLEGAAVVGGGAQVRITSTKTLVKGTLTSEDTVEVEP